MTLPLMSKRIAMMSCAVVGSRVPLMRSRRRKVTMWMRTSLSRAMRRMRMNRMWRAMIRMRMRNVVARTWKRSSLRVRSVSTSYATPKRFIRNCVLKCNMPNIGSCVGLVTRIIATMTFANSVNRFTLALAMLMMMISGSGVMNAIGG